MDLLNFLIWHVIGLLVSLQMPYQMPSNQASLLFLELFSEPRALFQTSNLNEYTASYFSSVLHLDFLIL